MRDTERVLELEALYPGLKFSRYPEEAESEYAGQPVGWGMIPEQATGTLDGNPFYYRFRSNYGKLSVWDKSRFTVDSVPSYRVLPILHAEVTNWIDGEDYAGATEGIALFQHLMENLAEPTGLDTYPGRLSENRKAEGLPAASEVREVLQRVAPSITYPKREVEWDGTAELIFDVGELGHVELRWDSYLQSDTGVTVVLYTPSEDVTASGRPVGFSSYSTEKVTSENVVSGLFESWSTLKWEHTASYSNYWDRRGFYITARLASPTRTDLTERFEREYGIWLVSVEDTIRKTGLFLSSVKV